MDWKNASTLQKVLASILFFCAGFGVIYYFVGDHSFKVIGEVALFLMFGLIALRPKQQKKK